MSYVSDEQQAPEPSDLAFILAIAGRLDAQSRILAQKLDKDRLVYYVYSILDSLSSSYSMFKYFFDVLSPSKDSDSMHDFLNSPTGIITITAESVFLVAFSFLACRFENEKEDSYKKFIATAWPYFRDVMKGLKNAYKGWKSTVEAFGLISGVDAKFLIIPAGVALGVLAAANRFWIRSMLEERKQMMKANMELLIEIKKLMSLSHEERITYLKQIKYQALRTRGTAYCAVAAGGLLDGLYLYVGVLGLAVLSPPLLAAMAAICIFYTAACVITRLYEEYDFQLKLLITQTQCQLLLITRELETSYKKLLLLKEKSFKNQDDLEEIERLEKAVINLINQFDDKRSLLSRQSNRTYFTSALLGMKNGLYAYGALASVLFLVGSILVLTGISFPPALLVSCIITGLVLIVGFTLHAVITNYVHLKKQNKQDERPYDRILKLKKDINTELSPELLEAHEFHKSLNDGLSLDPSPQFFIQEWCEVFRSLFSGCGKGQKFVDFAGNSLQERGDDGYYHDTPVMHVLSIMSALLFGSTLALRAFARGLGRKPLGQIKLTEDTEELPVMVETEGGRIQKTQEITESIQPEKSRTDSPKRPGSLLSSFGIFENTPPKNYPPKPSIRHSISETTLDQLSSSQNNTILGLA
ncbi:hypothetical protein EP47_02750 [Legionella norrlandica]|uniref:Transmembrane protein n=1 Tax=Legionella norrlandica TaxID=1498499 RepID=A0A0A2SUA1_9GAMM|nr:hypothetical protein [Legionella norrlandica]KGP62989.1 hypothetical protein EP47_02750 [Legionella norrlandica]